MRMVPNMPLLKTMINNPDYGLLAQVTDEQRIFPLTGAPTPDDLDELLTKVWKEPAFFLTHPLAIAAFGREATRRGTPPPTISLFGSQFITSRRSASAPMRRGWWYRATTSSSIRAPPPACRCPSAPGRSIPPLRPTLRRAQG